MIKIKMMSDGHEVDVEIRRAGLSVMSVLERWGILGLAQLEGLVFHKELDLRTRRDLFFSCKFEGEYRGAGYKVMGRLEKRGLVAVHRFANVPRVYTLTRKGHEVLLKAGLAKLEDYRDFVADSLVNHELLVTGIGLTISEILGLRVSTEFERQVMSRGAKQKYERGSFPLPDLWVNDSDQPKAIEIERTQKSAIRYRNLWNFYRGGIPRGAVVLYVTAFPNGPKLLLFQARKLLADFIYFCSLEDFQASLGRCPFIGYRGGEIYLKRRPEPIAINAETALSIYPPERIRILS
jgi:hypothetical protein